MNKFLMAGVICPKGGAPPVGGLAFCNVQVI